MHVRLRALKKKDEPRKMEETRSISGNQKSHSRMQQLSQSQRANTRTGVRRGEGKDRRSVRCSYLPTKPSSVIGSTTVFNGRGAQGARILLGEGSSQISHGRVSFPHICVVLGFARKFILAHS